METPLIMEQSRPGRRAVSLPACDVPEVPVGELVPERFLRTVPLSLPEVGEAQLVRHYTRLSQKNFGVDTHFYPLGSCTMKYNPKRNESLAALPGFLHLHPYQADAQVQGVLEILHRTEEMLKEITALAGVSLQPAAGAHGELASLMVARAYFRARGEGDRRRKVLIPDSAHGTNPASVTLCGCRTVQVRSDGEGLVDLGDLEAKLGEDVVVLMLTNPNTLGLFERNIRAIADRLHEAGALLYLDGANLNAMLGLVRPGDFGVDLMHFNLHKTFSTPHGGGGPGSGPIGVSKELVPYLPVPRVVKDGRRYRLHYDEPRSIGRVRSFLGNVNVVIKAYCYLRSLNQEDLRNVARHAVLNANYVKARLRDHYLVPYDRFCMHEFVASAKWQKKQGIRALDVAKRLIDLGFHPPTVYFPLIVEEALMIEPTETEGKETLDAFADALIRIAREAEEDPEGLHEAPVCQPVRRLDEVTAARNPILCYRPPEEN
jgi:glycine dehydrogenase subunit 2